MNLVLGVLQSRMSCAGRLAQGTVPSGWVAETCLEGSVPGYERSSQHRLSQKQPVDLSITIFYEACYYKDFYTICQEF